MTIDHLYWEAECKKCNHTWKPETRKLEIALSSDLPLDCPSCGYEGDGIDLALISDEPEE